MGHDVWRGHAEVQNDRFTLKDVCSIADIFDVSVDYLLGRDDDVIRR